jgi:hypothetical protein
MSQPMIEVIGFIFGIGFSIWLLVVAAVYIAVRYFEDL